MIFRRLLAILIVPATLNFLACIERKPEVLTKKESPVTAELTSMLREHEQMRASGKYSDEVISEADLRHRHTVYQLLTQLLIVEPVDLFRASILLQNEDTALCPDNLMLAYYCAVESARRGYGQARRQAAEAMDKYLLANGLPQKYGTQFGKGEGGIYSLRPYDSTTTDYERANWNVPSLDSLKLLAARKSVVPTANRP